MKAFCTYCSREKEASVGLLPAIKRYRSSRMREIADLAKRHGAGFVVLSGKFGLLEAHEPVPYYDYLLQADDVAHMADVVARQIKEKGIEHITFVTNPPEGRPQLGPYTELIKRACSKADISLEVRVRKGGEMSDWRAIMKEAEEAKQLLMRDRFPGEEAFEELLKRHGPDGMIYFKRAEGWERLKEWQLALRDYQKAEELFPMPDWKKRAREGANRVQGQILPQEIDQWNRVRSRLQNVPGIGPILIDRCGEAFDLIAKDPQSALIRLRTVVELVADHLIKQKNIDCAPSVPLIEKLRALQNSGVVRGVIVSHMHTVRVLGNEGAHGGRVSRSDAEVSRTALLAILEGVFPPSS